MLISGIPSRSYIVMTAYSITIAYLTEGVCVTTSGPPIELPTPYSIAVATSADSQLVYAMAASSFIDALGFTSCAGGGEEVAPTVLIPMNGTPQTIPPQAIPTSSPILLTTSVATTSLPPPLETATADSTPSRPTRQVKISIGIAVPVIAIFLSSIAYLLWRRFRKNKKPHTRKEEESSTQDEQPYLQRKAELEAEEKRKYELDAQQRRYELDGASNIIHEIPVGTREQGMLSLGNRHELRGEEHSKELEGR